MAYHPSSREEAEELLTRAAVIYLVAILEGDLKKEEIERQVELFPLPSEKLELARKAAQLMWTDPDRGKPGHEAQDYLEIAARPLS